MIKTVILTILLVLMAALAMSFKVLLVKGGKFPWHHHGNIRQNNRG